MGKIEATGFSLIELIVALGIAALVTAVLFAAYHTVIRTAEQQGLRGRAASASARALDQVSRDLACALHVPDTPALRFALGVRGKAGGDGEQVLVLTTTRPPAADPDLRWFTVEQVTYLFRGDTLYRIARPLPEEQGVPATTNVAARGVRRFEPSAWAGEVWTNVWPLDERSDPLPPAVRVRIETAAGRDGPAQAFDTEVYIPAGNAVTSSLTRVGGTGPEPR